ncbi:hypothetical protein GMLC_21560 [Geomonas limicola]|uniref:Uncharacterized protein n=1 Tax=Geomonas limicola TaxID=2740186 RepID=A0A6V8N9T9_9BACT|nr:hypothetical protein [Geomonas limicola]GFO68577.1 hypothetical protein GMLC_21560 [Geomonas limicola]
MTVRIGCEGVEVVESSDRHTLTMVRFSVRVEGAMETRVEHAYAVVRESACTGSKERRLEVSLPEEYRGALDLSDSETVEAVRGYYLSMPSPFGA